MSRKQIRASAATINRLLILSTVLLLAHLLTIQASDLEAMGLKVHISDPSMIRGAIALVFLHYFFAFATRAEYESSLAERRITNFRLRNAVAFAYANRAFVRLNKAFSRFSGNVAKLSNLKSAVWWHQHITHKSGIKSAAKIFYINFKALSRVHSLILSVIIIVGSGFALVDAYLFLKLVAQTVLSAIW